MSSNVHHYYLVFSPKIICKSVTIGGAMMAYQVWRHDHWFWLLCSRLLTVLVCVRYSITDTYLVWHVESSSKLRPLSTSWIQIVITDPSYQLTCMVHTGKLRLWHLTIRIIGRILLRPSFAQVWYVHFSIFEYFTSVRSILHRFTHANSMFESLVVPVTFSNEADEVYID